jgi:uncharacterized membrane protein
MKLLLKISLIMLVIDALWLNLYMGKIFNAMMKNITGKTMKLDIFAAILAYACMVLGVRYLGIPNVRNTHILKDSLWYGTLLGLLSFGVFDFTNKAIIPGYKWDIALLDVLWGCLLNISTLYLTKTVILF